MNFHTKQVKITNCLKVSHGLSRTLPSGTSSLPPGPSNVGSGWLPPSGPMSCQTRQPKSEELMESTYQCASQYRKQIIKFHQAFPRCSRKTHGVPGLQAVIISHTKQVIVLVKVGELGFKKGLHSLSPCPQLGSVSNSLIEHFQ